MVDMLRTRFLKFWEQLTPNQLTLARLAALPVLTVFLLIPGSAAAWIALFVYAALCGTDALDGYLARTRGLTSEFGTMLDPIADKLLVTLVIILLAFDGRIDGWGILPALAILLREILVSGLRDYLSAQNVALPVSPLAKWKTAAQMVALGFLIVSPYALFGLPLYGLGVLLFWAAAGLTLYTGYAYWQVLPVDRRLD